MLETENGVSPHHRQEVYYMEPSSGTVDTKENWMFEISQANKLYEEADLDQRDSLNDLIQVVCENGKWVEA